MLWLAREDGEGRGCKGWLLPGAEGLEQSRVTHGSGREGGRGGSRDLLALPQAPGHSSLRSSSPSHGWWEQAQVLSSVGLCGLGCTEPLSCPCWWPLPGQPSRAGQAQGDAAPKQFRGSPCSRISPPGQSLISRLQEKQTVPGITSCSAEHLLRHWSTAPPWS